MEVKSKRVKREVFVEGAPNQAGAINPLSYPTEHDVAMGVIPSSCVTPDVSMSPSSISDIMPSLYSTLVVTLPPCSTSAVALPPCSASDASLPQMPLHLPAFYGCPSLPLRHCDCHSTSMLCLVVHTIPQLCREDHFPLEGLSCQCLNQVFALMLFM